MTVVKGHQVPAGKRGATMVSACQALQFFVIPLGLACSSLQSLLLFQRRR